MHFYRILQWKKGGHPMNREPYLQFSIIQDRILWSWPAISWRVRHDGHEALRLYLIDSGNITAHGQYAPPFYVSTDHHTGSFRCSHGIYRISLSVPVFGNLCYSCSAPADLCEKGEYGSAEGSGDRGSRELQQLHQRSKPCRLTGIIIFMFKWIRVILFGYG